MLNDRKKMIGIALAMLAAPAAAQVVPGQLARETAKQYREMARYPETSYALKREDADPILAKRLPTRQTRRGPDNAGPALSVWSAKVSFETGQPVDLFATLEETGKTVAAAEVTGEIVDAAGNVLDQLTYRDDGQAPDQRAGDGVYSARVEAAGLPAGTNYLVRVRARLLSGDLREAAGGFLYSDPAAHLTGRYRDFLRDGDLHVAAEVEVTEAGRFHLAGTLCSAAGEPLGVAQAAAQLEPGRRWIELSFYGLMFHDRQAAGPYKLGTLALSTTLRMPNALNDLATDVHLTRPYRIEQMRNVSFERPQLLESAQRLEREAERAEREARGLERQ